MGALSPAAKDRALRHLFGGTLWLGLASAAEDGALVELRDGAYARQRIRFGDPSDGAVASAARISFPPFEQDMTRPLRWWFISDRARGDGEILASGETEPRLIDPESGEMYAPGEAAAREKALGNGWRARLKETWPKPRAGEEPTFAAGAVRIWMEDR